MKKLFTLLIFLTYISQAQSQGISNNWLMGYDGWGTTLPFGNTRLDFSSGSPSISHSYLPMEFRHSHSNISDDQGNLLFYTNGVYIADASNDTMLGGGYLNPSIYTSNNPDGLTIPQNSVIIRKPGTQNIYYMLHNTIDSYPIPPAYSYRLYITEIDMSLNGGLGVVTFKNLTIVNDTLNVGKISAVRHANGRDWWIMIHRVNTNMFYKLLITPNGISITTQNIGIVRFWDAGQTYFSPDGTRYAYFYINGGLEIFDFDRCSGMLSNPVHITIPYENGYNVGFSFSPNSNLLYVSNIFHIYQFDLTSANIAASIDTVATFDGFLSYVSPYPQFPTLFSLAGLGPDGKIYITTGNSTLHMHTIDNPDITGLGCNVNQHSLQLPAYYYNTIPNHPNYFLGNIQGSPCDTILGVGLNEPKSIELKAYPNPGNGKFTLQFPVTNESGNLELFDELGRIIFNNKIAPWSQYKVVEKVDLSSGVYFCKVSWDTHKSGVIKILIE